MKRAAEWSPPQAATNPRSPGKAAAQTTSLRSLPGMGVLAVAALALASAPAFAQRGGGSHSVIVSSHLGGGDGDTSGRPLSETGRIGSGDAQGLNLAKSSVSPEPSKNMPAEMLVASADSPPASALAGGVSLAPASAVDLRGREQGSQVPGGQLAAVYPRSVTIGFPPLPAEGFGVSSRRSGFVIAGERSELWAEGPQRGAASQHASAPVRGAPMSAARVATTPAPVASVRLAPLSRPIRRPASPSPLSFLWQRPGATSPPHVFWPRRRYPPIFGGFGFFGPGFGFPFLGLGFASECNPFWVWPWALGCETYGYWNGYGAGFDVGYDQAWSEQEEQQEMEQPPQEPETFTYIPPPEESSPEEIQAEKILVVLYMKSGAVYAITNYWVADGKLHYLTSYGGENSIDLNDLDLQKTVDVNAKRGVEFTLKPGPDHHSPNPQSPQDQPNPPDLQD
jgi:hypothetical protein